MENLTMKQWGSGQYNSFYHFMSKIDVDALHKFLVYNEPYARIGNFVVEVCEEKGTVTILNTNSGKCAIAHCAPSDKFTLYYGVGICWARYNHVEPPKFAVKKRLSDLKPHDVFSLYTNRKYEFIGTTSEGKYVGYVLGRDECYSFIDDYCTVWE